MTTLLYDDPVDLAYLTTEDEQRYVFGDTDVPLLTLNAVDDFGVMWACPEPQGWDSPTASTPMDERQDGHGGYLGETFYEPRPLSFAGSAKAPSHADARAARARLLQAITSTLDDQVLYTHIDDDPAKSLWLRISGKPRIELDGLWLDYAFVMVAEDPIKFGDEHLYGPTYLPSAASAPGLLTPLTTPLTVVGVAGSNIALEVANPGDMPAHAIYTIKGPIPKPIVQVSGGEFLGLTIDLAATDTAVIDTDLGTVEVNGVNRYDAWLTGSTFPMIPGRDPFDPTSTGGATVRLRSGGGSTSQVPYLTVMTAPRYR